ncbi:MAG: recombination mediator RecR [Dehalococcoidia bacterium]
MNQEATPNTDAVSRLVQELNRLPGIGPKSAQRLAFHLLRAPEEDSRRLANAILSLKQETKREQRDHTKICIVEQPQDILALEHTGVYSGLYHVLHGAISPTEGIGAGDVRIKELMARLEGGLVSEVILATNTNLDGEQTALYLNKLITPLGIRVTRLARGLPFGTELEYADDVTLTRALEGRQEL